MRRRWQELEQRRPFLDSTFSSSASATVSSRAPTAERAGERGGNRRPAVLSCFCSPPRRLYGRPASERANRLLRAGRRRVGWTQLDLHSYLGPARATAPARSPGRLQRAGSPPTPKPAAFAGRKLFCPPARLPAAAAGLARQRFSPAALRNLTRQAGLAGQPAGWRTWTEFASHEIRSQWRRSAGQCDAMMTLMSGKVAASRQAHSQPPSPSAPVQIDPTT